MSTTSTLAPTAVAARRLRLAATIFERHAVSPNPMVIDVTTKAFQVTASALEDLGPCATDDLPADVDDTLTALADVYGAHDVRLSPALLQYATEPLTGERPSMPLLNAVSEKLTNDEYVLRKRRNTMLHLPHLDSEDDEIVSWALLALARIHYQYERLALVVAEDNARPENRNKTPYHLVATRPSAKKAARAAGPRDGDKLIAALRAYGIPAWFSEDSGISYVIAGVDKTRDEGEAHTGPKVFIYSGESADQTPDQHVEPWSCALYDRDGDFVDILFTARIAQRLDDECAEAALCLAAWLTAHAAKHPRY